MTTCMVVLRRARRWFRDFYHNDIVYVCFFRCVEYMRRFGVVTGARGGAEGLCRCAVGCRATFPLEGDRPIRAADNGPRPRAEESRLLIRGVPGEAQGRPRETLGVVPVTAPRKFFSTFSHAASPPDVLSARSTHAGHTERQPFKVRALEVRASEALRRRREHCAEYVARVRALLLGVVWLALGSRVAKGLQSGLRGGSRC